MQLAVDVQIPDEFGGLNGEAIYIGIIRFFHRLKAILTGIFMTYFWSLYIGAFLLYLSSFAISLNPPLQKASHKCNDMLKPSRLLLFQYNLS